ncbi:MAG: hypothetical protein L6R45_20555 [Anaerolineae bacterium]|nr:hypothetical protein [Anaerolineae bacterium]
MKILGRIFIILAAALVVAAATIALVGNDTGSFEAERSPVFQEQGDAVTAEQVSGRPPREGHDEASLFGIVGVLQNLVIISVIVLVVRLGGRAQRALARFGAWRHNS